MFIKQVFVKPIGLTDLSFQAVALHGSLEIAFWHRNNHCGETRFAKFGNRPHHPEWVCHEGIARPEKSGNGLSAFEPFGFGKCKTSLVFHNECKNMNFRQLCIGHKKTRLPGRIRKTGFV